MTASCVVGAVTGARLPVAVSQELLSRAFSMLLLGIATYCSCRGACLCGQSAR